MKYFRRMILVLLLALCFSANAERSAPAVVLNESCRAEICVVGDFVIHDSLIKSAKALSKSTNSALDCEFGPMLAYVKSDLKNADWTVANVDGVFLGNGKRAYSGYPAFNTPPSLLNALKDAGVDMLTMANNHALDFWYEGLKTSVETVEAAGFTHVGAARSQQEHDEPIVVDICGISFGFLNYTNSLNAMDQRSSLDKNALVYGVNFEKKADFAADVRALRDAGAEIVVCFFHWGVEYRDTPYNSQKNAAQKLVSAGVDVIIGGHPHVVQQAEWLEGKNQFGQTQRTLCVYSLGNFLSGQREAGRNGGIIFRFTVEKDAEGNIFVSDTSYKSTWVWLQRENGNNIYRVVPCVSSKNDMPKGMSSRDFETMSACKAIHDKAMRRGSLSPRCENE